MDVDRVPLLVIEPIPILESLEENGSSCIVGFSGTQPLGSEEIYGARFDEELYVNPNNRVVWSADKHPLAELQLNRKPLQLDWFVFPHDSTRFACVLLEGSLIIFNLEGMQRHVTISRRYTSFWPSTEGLILMGSPSYPLSILVHSLEPLRDFKFMVSELESFNVHDIVWSNAELAVVASYNANVGCLYIWKSTEPQPSSSKGRMSFGTTAMKRPSRMQDPGTPGHQRVMRTGNGALSPLAFQPTPTVPRGVDGEAQFNDSVHTCRLEKMFETNVPLPSKPSTCKVSVVHGMEAEPLICFFFADSGIVLIVELSKTMKIASLKLHLSGILAVEAVAGLRSKRPGGQRERDLLVLYNDYRMELYCGWKPIWNVSLRIKPPQTETYLNVLQTREVPPVYGGPEGSAAPDVPSTTPAIVGIKDSNGNRLTLRLQSGIDVRVGLLLRPLGTAATELLRAVQEDSYRKDHDVSKASDRKAYQLDPSGTLACELTSLMSLLGGIDALAPVDVSAWNALSGGNEEQRNIYKNYYGGITCGEGLISGVQNAFLDAQLHVLRRHEIPFLKQLTIVCSASHRERDMDTGTDLNSKTFVAGDAQKYLKSLLNLDFGEVNKLPDETRYGLILSCFLIMRRSILQVIDGEQEDSGVVALSTRDIVERLIAHGWTQADLNTLPAAMSSPIYHFLEACQRKPAEVWKSLSYECVGRYMATTQFESLLFRRSNGNPRWSSSSATFPDVNVVPLKQRAVQMPCLEWLTIKSATNMPIDEDSLMETRRESNGSHYKIVHQYILAVQNLLKSDVPRQIKSIQGLDADSSDLLQFKLLVNAVRTAALPFGRGALNLATYQALPTEPLELPALCLALMISERNNATVNFDDSAAAALHPGATAQDFSGWPDFHNGVAAGLKLAAGGQLARTWFLYNSPTSPSYVHGGMLLGLGLRGYLACLAMTDVYRYLSHEHDPTVVGVLLGMSAAKRGSMDPSVSKMLFLHLPSRHPSGYPELDIAPVVQTAALCGIGLLYQGTCLRSIVDILVQEIGRRPGSFPSEHSRSGGVYDHGITKDCEAYALAAGIGIGLICLGRGSSALNSKVESLLRYYMLGGMPNGTVATRTRGKTRNADNETTIESLLVRNESATNALTRDTMGRGPGAVAEEMAAAQGAAQIIAEGDLLNLNVTSPAATLALGLMYLQTNDTTAAEVFCPPVALCDLALINPRHLSLRAMMRALVMWNSIEPSQAWVTSQLPTIIQGTIFSFLKRRGNGPDIQTATQAHCFVLSGSILALGIRFAGTANKAAADVIHYNLQYFLRAKKFVPEPGTVSSSPLNREILETCISSGALALSVVMAGSGDLRTMKVLRALLKRLPTSEARAGNGLPLQTSLTFGSYAAVSLAIGILFLGHCRWRFERNLEAVSFLVISLFPSFPCLPNDGRYYLQALRHLYVLSAKELVEEEKARDAPAEYLAARLRQEDLSALIGGS